MSTTVFVVRYIASHFATAAEPVRSRFTRSRSFPDELQALRFARRVWSGPWRLVEVVEVVAGGGLFTVRRPF
jgi:hypothetical protein